ncbi:hypothetical protein CLV51_10526 [Chitinophaga niastensis]|uniref:ATP-GRASP peptide maturase of grasp-with-spasm system n=1 Tax=Chitinophaga niastensis TaxID=536980 RepID=A0A2P8HEP0_CHINA|nr:hypothetical protein [Chitinophaga niastensis]PSL44654.1 hypothetical protein CLV51_10526 [Chitinophaga niastensis]
MILILSFRQYEQGTDPVIDWLYARKANFIRISSQDIIGRENRYDLNVNEGSLVINGIQINLDEVKVIWDRRWQDSGLILNNYPENEWPYEQLIFEHDHEINYLTNYLHECFKDKIWLSSPFHEVNKLSMLKDAAAAGLNVPASAVINNKQDLLAFFHRCHNNIISKPIHHSHYFVSEEYVYSVYTNTFNTYEAIESLPEKFFPTLFQERICGEIEIRCFYLDGQFYPMAILTDQESKEETDIKLSFGLSTTKWVPYQLPRSLEIKLEKLLRTTDNNTGSIDLIKTTSGAYYFIEVNTGGQYNAPGFRGNYYLEEKIADWLITHSC